MTARRESDTGHCFDWSGLGSTLANYSNTITQRQLDLCHCLAARSHPQGSSGGSLNSTLKETADPKMKILTLSFFNTQFIPANLIMLPGVDFQIQKKAGLNQKVFIFLWDQISWLHTGSSTFHPHFYLTILNLFCIFVPDFTSKSERKLQKNLDFIYPITTKATFHIFLTASVFFLLCGPFFLLLKMSLNGPQRHKSGRPIRKRSL